MGPSAIDVVILTCHAYVLFVDGDVLEALKAMGPSAIDVELRSLDPETGGSMQLLAAFLTIINQTLLTNRDFELAQSYLALFLKVTF